MGRNLAWPKEKQSVARPTARPPRPTSIFAPTTRTPTHAYALYELLRPAQITWNGEVLTVLDELVLGQLPGRLLGPLRSRRITFALIKQKWNAQTKVSAIAQPDFANVSQDLPALRVSAQSVQITAQDMALAVPIKTSHMTFLSPRRSSCWYHTKLPSVTERTTL